MSRLQEIRVKHKQSELAASCLSKWRQGLLELCSLTFPSLSLVLLCQTTICPACHSSSSIWMVALEGKRNGKAYFRATKLGGKVCANCECKTCLHCYFTSVLKESSSCHGIVTKCCFEIWLKGKDHFLESPH